MDEFDLTPEEEEEMRTRFWAIVKKYRSAENDPELTPESNTVDLESRKRKFMSFRILHS